MPNKQPDRFKIPPPVGDYNQLHEPVSRLVDLPGFPYVSQLPQLWWCWVAVINMVTRYYKIPVTNCAIANYYFKRTDCCQNPLIPECDRGCDDDDIQDIYRHYGISSTRQSGALKPEEVKQEILAGRPIHIQTGNSQTAHQVVIRGFQELVSGNLLLFINDPQKVNTIRITYTQLAKKYYRYPSYKWQSSWFHLKPSGGLL